MSEKKVDKIHTLFAKNGEEALAIAKSLVLKEAGKLECEKARGALEYFINEYWHDVVTPAMIAISCRAAGGAPKKTIPVAVPIIMISGAVDIHDDIIDKSKSKYNRQTVVGKYGEEIAILAGDALLFKGLTLMQEASKKYRGKSADIMKILNDTFFELGDAESSEFGFKTERNLTPDKYISVMKKKAADIEGLFHIGAIIGNATPLKASALSYYGRAFGLLSILRDDWIDTLDSEELRHRTQFETLPLPILYAMQTQEARTQILAILQKCSSITKENAETLCTITDQFEGFKQTRKIMQDLVRETKSKLLKAKIESRDIERLLAFVSNI